MADRDPLAGEFALGLLEGDERAAAVRRLLAEPGFAADVEWWRTQFAALFDLWPEHDAPPQLAARVETSLDTLTRQSGHATDGVTTLRSGARSPWPWLAAASSAVAACLLLFIAVEPRSAPPVSQPIPAARPSSVLVAMLGDAKSPVAAVYDPATGALRVAAGPGVPDARVAQLWVIGGDGVPHSLGLLAARPTALAPRGADRGRIAPGATLAISIEPLGGSPTGLPTGPVVATGVVARV
ncbi:anti-sigma factor [Sphingomonas aerolata]|uniref:anti-sigma factor n=1 Tax=Sphingomonas aerolata TaxID=185951 RepID=UPI002FE0A8B6